MIAQPTPNIAFGKNRPNARVRKAFSLVELLTVIFIIGLLISILIPSISAARTSAKRATTAKTIDAIKVGLEMFKNDNERGFRRTNGYPPSFAHPKIPGYAFDPYLGEFPFAEDSESDPPTVAGAHWLPAMLLGVDVLGYVQRSSVPKANDLQKKPWVWYDNEELLSMGINEPLPRASFYIDPKTEMRPTRDLPGRVPEGVEELAPGYDQIENLPVIIDSFGQPILYYAANAHGRTTNLLEDERVRNNDYDGGVQQIGTPFYFHQDNILFTGRSVEEEDGFGWDFSGRGRPHPLGESGADLSASGIVDRYNDHTFAIPLRQTFARYIMDRKIWTSIQRPDAAKDSTPLRPVNADSYLLISAGPDGLFGTNDDVSNLPSFPD